jgi:hypothetical protein
MHQKKPNDNRAVALYLSGNISIIDGKELVPICPRPIAVNKRKITNYE